MSYLIDGTNQRLTGTFTSAYSATAGFTIAAWVKLPDWHSSNQLIAAIHNAADEFDESLQLQGLGTVDRVAATARSTTSGGASYTFGSADLYNGVWVPCVGVYTSQTARDIYINTISETAFDSSNRPSGDVKFVIIGNRIELLDAPLDGLVSHVAMWDVALSTPDITAYLASASQSDILAIDSSNLIGYWPLNVDQATHSNLGADSMSSDITVTNATYDPDDPFPSVIFMPHYKPQRQFLRR